MKLSFLRQINACICLDRYERGVLCNGLLWYISSIRLNTLGVCLNLVSSLRINTFTKIDLMQWLNEPFTPPPESENQLFE